MIIKIMCLPLKELKCRAQINRIVNIQAIVCSKHETDGRDEVGDVVIHNLAIHTQHEVS